LYGEALNRHRAAIGLPPVDNVRDHVLTDRPWLAADPTLCPSPRQDRPRRRADRGGDPARRTPAPGRAGCVPGHRRATGVRGLWQHGRARPDHIARVAIEAVRAQGRRVLRARGWGRFGADRRRRRLLRRWRGQPAGTVGWPPSCTTAARAPPRRRPALAPTGDRAADRGPAILGHPGGRAGHRHGTRALDADHRLPVRRAHHGPDSRDPEHEPGPWPAKSAPTGRRWPRNCSSTQPTR